MYDLSIIIPAYNAADYLHSSLGNALAQSVPTLEIILINDASTDDTRNVAQTLAADDPRVSIIDHDHNQGPAAARNTGIQQAQGRYLVFVDADDELSPDACGILLRELTSDPVDILQFPMELEIHGNLDEVAREHMSRYFIPPNQRIKGWDIVESAFLRYEHNWNLAGKAIETSLCKNALSLMPEEKILLGEDLLFYFFVAYAAKSYRGYTAKKLYKYRYGAGGSNRNLVDLQQFEQRWLTTARVFERIESEIADKQPPTGFDAVLTSIRRHLLGETMDAVIALLQPGERFTAITKIKEAWSASELICFLARAAWNDPYWAQDILSCEKWEHVQRSATDETTAYYSVKGASSENGDSIFQLAAQAQQASTLLVSEEALPYGASISTEAPIVSIAPRLPSTAEASYAYRAEVLEQLVQAYQIQTLVLLNYYQELYFWDVALLTLLGVRVIDAKGNDVLPTLYSASALKRALEQGQSGSAYNTLAEKDFVREHLGRDYALASYRHQALTQQAGQQARSSALKRLLRRPYHQLKWRLAKKERTSS